MLLREAKRYVKEWTAANYPIDINTALYFEHVLYDVGNGQTSMSAVYPALKSGPPYTNIIEAYLTEYDIRMSVEYLKENFYSFYIRKLHQDIIPEKKDKLVKLLLELQGSKSKPKKKHETKRLGDGELLRIGLWFIDKVGSPELASKVLNAACASYNIMKDK